MSDYILFWIEPLFARGTSFPSVNEVYQNIFRKKGGHRVIKELEIIRERFEQGSDPTQLMNEMERIFKIPVLSDLDFNEENPEVIELYREISKSRRVFDR